MSAAKTHALLDLGRYEDAARAAAEEIRRDPSDPDGHLLLAMACLGSERHDRALEAAGEAVRLAPNEEFGHRLRAFALRGLKRHREAVAAAEESLRLAPQLVAAHAALADCLVGAGDRKRAREVAWDGLDLDPEDAGLHQTLGDIAYELYQFPQAERHYRVVLAHDPENAAVLNNLGAVLSARGREWEAFALFEAAARLDPRFDVPRRNITLGVWGFLNGWAGVFALFFLVVFLVNFAQLGQTAGVVVATLALVATLTGFAIAHARRRAALTPSVRAALARRPWRQRLR
ncbi:MAG TPA: tetratricopeptide repeat protein [Solirubrobacteraceae bacterium]